MTASLDAQDRSDDLPQEVKRHGIALLIGYAWVPQTVTSEGGSELTIIPSIGLDYGYEFNSKFSLVLINDIELSSYLIEGRNGTTIKRANKYIVALTPLYHVNHWLGVYAGPGIEYEHSMSFYILKAGTEIYKHFEGNWGVGFSVSIDFNKSYETFSAGLGVSKGF